MLTLLLSLRDCFRARAVLHAEILALRHQLLVLQRSSRLPKLRLYWRRKSRHLDAEVAGPGGKRLCWPFESTDQDQSSDENGSRLKLSLTTGFCTLCVHLFQRKSKWGFLLVGNIY